MQRRPWSEYAPSSEYWELAKRCLPGWEIVRDSVWWHVRPPEKPPRDVGAHQGWKIHVSATPRNSIDVLTRTLEIAAQTHTAAKFILDKDVLRFSLSKQFDPYAAGKFVTLYPITVQAFLSLIDSLAVALQGFRAPEVVGDRRYREDSPVYYRYGVTFPEGAALKGYLFSPSGALEPDVRGTERYAPPWVDDPVLAAGGLTHAEGSSVNENESSRAKSADDSRKLTVVINGNSHVLTLRRDWGIGLRGPMRVDSVLQRNPTGTVALCRDNAGGRILLKTGRNSCGWIGARDAASVREHEAAMLTRLGGDYFPEIFGVAEDDGGVTILEEYVAGIPVSSFGAACNPLLSGKSVTPQDICTYQRRIDAVFSGIQMVVDHAHDECGVILGDVNPSNMLFDLNTMRLKFIDVESAFEISTKPVADFIQSSFASLDQRKGKLRTGEDDWFGAAASICEAVTPMSRLRLNSTSAWVRSLTTAIEELESRGVDLDVVRHAMEIVAPDRCPSPAGAADFRRHLASKAVGSGSDQSRTLETERAASRETTIPWSRMGAPLVDPAVMKFHAGVTSDPWRDIAVLAEEIAGSIRHRASEPHPVFFNGFNPKGNAAKSLGFGPGSLALPLMARVIGIESPPHAWLKSDGEDNSEGFINGALAPALLHVTYDSAELLTALASGGMSRSGRFVSARNCIDFSLGSGRVGTLLALALGYALRKNTLRKNAEEGQLVLSLLDDTVDSLNERLLRRSQGAGENAVARHEWASLIAHNGLADGRLGMAFGLLASSALIDREGALNNTLLNVCAQLVAAELEECEWDGDTLLMFRNPGRKGAISPHAASGSAGLAWMAAAALIRDVDPRALGITEKILRGVRNATSRPLLVVGAGVAQGSSGMLLSHCIASALLGEKPETATVAHAEKSLRAILFRDVQGRVVQPSDLDFAVCSDGFYDGLIGTLASLVVSIALSEEMASGKTSRSILVSVFNRRNLARAIEERSVVQ